MRDFGLRSFQQIENWMCPKEFCKSPRVVQVLKNWGYHDSENIAAEAPSDDKKEQTSSLADQNSTDTNLNTP